MIIYDEYPTEEIIELLNAQYDHSRDGGGFSNSPINQFEVREYVKKLKSAFDDGDSKALFECVACCAEAEIPLPDWTAAAMIQAYEMVKNKKSSSWDGVFGKPFSNTRVPQLKCRESFVVRVGWLVSGLQGEGWATDDNLFDEVGRQLGLGKTTVKKIYYENVLEIRDCVAGFKEKVEDCFTRNKKWEEKYRNHLKRYRENSA